MEPCQEAGTKDRFPLGNFTLSRANDFSQTLLFLTPVMAAITWWCKASIQRISLLKFSENTSHQQTLTSFKCSYTLRNITWRTWTNSVKGDHSKAVLRMRSQIRNHERKKLINLMSIPHNESCMPYGCYWFVKRIVVVFDFVGGDRRSTRISWGPSQEDLPSTCFHHFEVSWGFRMNYNWKSIAKLIDNRVTIN